LATIPGISVYMRNDPPINIGGIKSKALFQYTLQSPGTDELYRASREFETTMRGLSAIQDVSSDLQIRNPQINVLIDRDSASALGVTPNQIETALYSAYGMRQVSTIFAPDNQYRVIMELEPQYQHDASSLAMLHIRSNTGQLVPLNGVAKLSNS